MYWAAVTVRFDAAVKVGGGEAGLQTDWTCRLNRWPRHAASNSSFTFPRDETMLPSFHTCCLGLLHAAVSLPPPHSLRLTECSCDRSVSLVGWGGRLAGVAGRPSGYRCVPVIQGLLYNKASSTRLPLSMSPTACRATWWWQHSWLELCGISTLLDG